MKRILLFVFSFLLLFGCTSYAYASQNSADLIPMPITYDAATISVGDTVYFDSGIMNSGTADAVGFNIKWYVDDVQSGYGFHSGIPSGEIVMNGNSQFYWTPQTPGMHYIRFNVDTDNFVAESNETNNTLTIVVTVFDRENTPAPAYTDQSNTATLASSADLAALPISYDAETIVAGEPVLFKSGIRNIGAADTDDFNIMWKVNGTQAENGYGAHRGVPAGVTVTDDAGDQYQWTPQAEGTYTITFTADIDQFYPDGNTGNNTSELTVEVAGQPTVPWQTMTFIKYPLEPVLLAETQRRMGYLGPSKKYMESAAYKPYKMARAEGLFIEGDYVFVDMYYTSVGVRRTYFTRSTFHSTSNVPQVTLTGYPAVTTQNAEALYGPGAIYDLFPEASVGPDTALTVFFEEDGYVFSEYTVGSQLVRAWIDVNSVAPR